MPAYSELTRRLGFEYNGMVLHEYYFENMKKGSTTTDPEQSSAFRRMHKSVPSSKGPVEQAVDDIIDFKTAAEKGIQTGKIKSIIHPALADHVRREALKAADELRRAA